MLITSNCTCASLRICSMLVQCGQTHWMPHGWELWKICVSSAIRGWDDNKVLNLISSSSIIDTSRVVASTLNQSKLSFYDIENKVNIYIFFLVITPNIISKTLWWSSIIATSRQALRRETGWDSWAVWKWRRSFETYQQWAI